MFKMTYNLRNDPNIYGGIPDELHGTTRLIKIQ
jgi:hypothetical protein